MTEILLVQKVPYILVVFLQGNGFFILHVLRNMSYKVEKKFDIFSSLFCPKKTEC